jgi:GNAT superfamily N-acetyltransferase
LRGRDAAVRETLLEWLQVGHVLGLRNLSGPTLARLVDLWRVGGELFRVLAGSEAGDGPSCERILFLAESRGRIQAISSMFACPRGAYIEYLLAAPWNALRKGDPPDPRTVRGAGTALVAAATAYSQSRGSGGRVALRAENARARVFYEGLGFQRLGAEHDPSSFVPKFPAEGFASSPAVEDRDSLMLLDPGWSAHVDAGAPGMSSRLALLRR